MANKIDRSMLAPEGTQQVLQGNIAFAVGCLRGGLHAADGYPGTPSTEVIDKGLRHAQEHMRVGWSVNEATAVGVGHGYAMAGHDAVVTMKIPGLFQAGDVVATLATYTASRGALVLYIASDFVPSSTQYVTDPRYFLRSCFLPILEPRDHQELLEVGPLAAQLSREHATLVAILVNGLLCHSEGLVRLGARREVPPIPREQLDFKAFMNLPGIARRNYEDILARRVPGLEAFAERSPLTRVEWHDRRLGVVTHGITESYLREAWGELPIKPSILSLGLTSPLPLDKIRAFAAQIAEPLVVLGDGYRFVREQLASHGIAVTGKDHLDPLTEWTPADVAHSLGAPRRPSTDEPVPAVQPIERPATICAGCSYRGFALVVEKLRRKKRIVASFGDIGCNTLLYFMQAIDTCACMGLADSQRQGVVLARPELAGKTISVIGDSTECHSGLDSTRNAIFRGIAGVKVVLDNGAAAMTGGQPGPSAAHNLAGETHPFDLVAALRGEGAVVHVLDGFDMPGIERALLAGLEGAAEGRFTVLVVRGRCTQEIPAAEKFLRFEIDAERCTQCDLCLVCPGLEKADDGAVRFTQLCTGCAGEAAICVQRCHRDAVVTRQDEGRSARSAAPPAFVAAGTPARVEGLPPSIRVAVRGVGGQGNLFLGKVLAEVALLAGYERIVKGETHGMAQLGGSVISTFACGDVYSSVLLPGSVDVLVALEYGEILRPGFLALGRPRGVVLLNRLRIVPTGKTPNAYPAYEAVRGALGDRQVIEFDAQALAAALGDTQGRTSNVVALGVLSTIEPFAKLPPDLWQAALVRVSPSELAQRANIAAFAAGRGISTRSVS